MELTKKDTKMIQGLSVMALICLHLFCRYDYEALYQPLVYFRGIPLSFYIAQLSDFCVVGFAFCSGYAHMLQFLKNGMKGGYYQRRLKALVPLLINYWIVLVIFSIISILAGNGADMPGNMRTFFRNVLLDPTYNGAWWYLYAYVFVVLISPIFLKMVKNRKTMLVLIIGFLIYGGAYYIRFKLHYSNWILEKAGPIGMTIFEYLLGAIFYKLKIFTQMYEVWKKVPSVVRTVISVIIMFGLLWGRTVVVPSLFVAPITAIIIITLFHFWRKPQWIENVFLLVGRHSTNIWLTHMFFYLVIFKNFVYYAKYPILIFAFMLIITIMFSKVIQIFENIIINKISLWV